MQDVADDTSNGDAAHLAPGAKTPKGYERNGPKLLKGITHATIVEMNVANGPKNRKGRCQSQTPMSDTNEFNQDR